MSGIIGRHIKWKHKDQHGNPSVDLKGEVVMVVQPLNTTFVNLLVLKNDGSLAVAQHTDVEVDDTPVTSPAVLALADTIGGLGLGEGMTMGDENITSFARNLLHDFMKELREVNDRATALEAELAKLKTKKAKKPEETP